MMGDAADNIQDCLVWEKSPQEIPKEYGSMENLLANTDKLKGKNIEANKEKSILSKTLATILLDCPLFFDEKDYELSTQMSKKDALLTLEFRRMAEQFDSIFKRRYRNCK
jgi:DNA polymerase-1